MQSKNERVMTQLQQRLEEAPGQPDATLGRTTTFTTASQHRAAPDQLKPASQQPSMADKAIKAAVTSIVQHEATELVVAIPVESPAAVAAADGVSTLLSPVAVTADAERPTQQLALAGAQMVTEAVFGKESEVVVAELAPTVAVKANGQAQKANAR